MSCYDYHSSCIQQNINKIGSTFKYVLKMYSIAHGIPTLIFRWNELKTQPLKTLYHLLVRMLKSMGFLGGFIISCRVVTCSYCNITNKPFDKLCVFILGLLCGLPVLTENTSRITEYSVFTIPRVLEGLLNLIIRLKWIKYDHFIGKLTFAISMAAILVIMEHKNEYLSSNYTKFMNFIFGFEERKKLSAEQEIEKKTKEYMLAVHTILDNN